MKARFYAFLALVLPLLFVLGGPPPAPAAGAWQEAPTSVAGTVILQGAVQHSGVSVQMGLETAITSSDGSFAFSDVVPGVYTITAEAPGYLMARLTDVKVNRGESVEAEPLELPAGDLNGDGIVDRADLEAVIGELDRSPPQNPLADYNGDGDVDIRDLVLVAGNRGKRETGGAAVDTTSITGMASNIADGNPIEDALVTLQVDVDGDGIFAPLGQTVSSPALDQSFPETYSQATDLQGLFAFEEIPFLSNGEPLVALVDLQKVGYGTLSQRLTFNGDTFINLPLEATEQINDADASDGVQAVTATGEMAQVEVQVPPEALPPGTTSVTAFVNSSNPRENPDLSPGTFLASDPALGEVQLESTVYAYVELRDQNGEPILTSDNPAAQPALLRIEIPPDQYVTLRDVTPDNPNEVNVPLYYYDYDAATWRLSDTQGRLETADGAPVPQEQLTDIWSGRFAGDLYITAQVSHFSRWNVDYPRESHSANCGQVVDRNGNPVRGARIHSFGTTYTSNWAKTQVADGDGTFCDDNKVSEEEEPEEETERTPPAVEIIDARVVGSGSGRAEFSRKLLKVFVRVRYQGDETQRDLKIKVKLKNEGEDAVFATLEDQKTGLAKRPDVVIFEFNLAERGVPRFREHVEIESGAEARETWSDPTETLLGADDHDQRIPLPVIITHGILGDFAATPGLGYGSVGPGLAGMAYSLSRDGYEVGGVYPSVHTLVYPSLHANGIKFISQSFLSPLVDQVLEVDTYAARLDLVAHSMGGLVSRYYIESSPGLNHGDKVRKLIMIGTPNEGAAGAHIGVEGDGVFALSADNTLGLGDFFGATGASGETNLGIMTSQELLPVYPYYREKTSLRMTGYGWPFDQGMDLGIGSSGDLNFNKSLKDLNTDGLDRRVENYIIYRSNQDTTTTILREEGLVFWSVTEEKGPGDGTVPVRSAIMSDFPAASAQLKKCRISGDIHPKMLLDPNIRRMVSQILKSPVGEEPPGCNPQNALLPLDRNAATRVLQSLPSSNGSSHPTRELGFTTISGMAGELRRLENRSPAVLSRMSNDLQSHVENLNDAQVANLARALQRWGIETQSLWRHAPRFGQAAQTAADSDPSRQRTTLMDGVTGSFLHNVAQACIQMTLNVAAASHSSREPGQFASHMADLQGFAAVLDVMATNRLATQTWSRIEPVLGELSGMTPGLAADAKLLELENLLLALAGEEEYSSWVFRSDNQLVGAPRPQGNKGGAERARIEVLWQGMVFRPEVSDNGVNWQDIGIPRLRTSSTAWIGTPSLSSAKPARWIGAAVIEPPDTRRITGKLVTPQGDPVPNVALRATLTASAGAQSSATATTQEDGGFAVDLFQGFGARLLITDRNIRPIEPLPPIPQDNQDIDLGNIQIGAVPQFAAASATPTRPARGATLQLSAEATHSLGSPLTYKWERQVSRWAWEEIGAEPVIEWQLPPGPQAFSLRVTASDGVFQRSRSFYIAPENRSPEVLSLEAESMRVSAGQEVSLTAVAQDPDDDPLTYRWRVYPGWWSPWPAPTQATATWRAPWSPNDRTYNVSVEAFDGARRDRATLEITVTGRPDHTTTIDVSPSEGGSPLEIAMTAMADDPLGEIVRYDWTVQKQSRYRYFYRRSAASTPESARAQTLEEPGTYRVRVAAVNDIGRSAASDWVEVVVLASPTVELSAGEPDGLTILFTANARDAEPGRVVKYSWDFQGAGTVDQVTTDNTVSHTYSVAGAFQARVTAEDNDGLTASAAVTVTVCTSSVPIPGNQVPHALIGAATIDGRPVPDGTRITAMIGCQPVAEAIITDGKYSLVIAEARGTSYANQVVTFKVGELLATQKVNWARGSIDILNLTASR